MTTVTLNIDEALLEKAKTGLERWGLTLDEFFTSVLAPYSEGEASIREYEGILRRNFIVRPAKPPTHHEIDGQ